MPLVDENGDPMGEAPLQDAARMAAIDAVETQRVASGYKAPKLLVDENGNPVGRSDADIRVGATKEAAKAVVRSTADLGDMILSVPTMGLSLYADAMTRLKGVVEGKSHSEVSALAGAERDRINAAAPTILRSLVEKVVAKLAPDEDTPSPSAVQTGMEVVTEGLKSGGKGIEKLTGGVINAEDFMSLANEAMALGGLKGAVPRGKAAVTESVRAAVQAQLEKGAADRTVPLSRPDATGARPTVDAYTDLLKGKNLVDENGVPIEKAAPPTAAPDLVASGLEKLKAGKFGDVTPEELSALAKDTLAGGDAWTPEGVGKVAAVAGVGAALAAMYPSEDKSDFATATFLAGALLAGRHADFAAKPESSTLGVMLEGSQTTLKTLERLPQNHSEFTKQMIEEQLRRPDVTKAEKEVFATIIGSMDKDRISAKNLVLQFKEATGDFELTANPTYQHAHYGLENLDRLEAPDMREHDGVVVGEADAPPATTTLYRLPDHMPMSDANHFRDPQLFGWTRSFIEEGKRHVVEIQSDLVQNAKGGLKHEEIPAALKEHEQLRTALDLIKNNWGKYVHPNQGVVVAILDALGRKVPGSLEEIGKWIQDRYHYHVDESPVNALKKLQDYLQTNEPYLHERRSLEWALESAVTSYRNNLGVRIAELRTKIESGTISSQLAPMMKGWWKRLIREELAGAHKDTTSARRWWQEGDADVWKGQPGEFPKPAVRFATADTVAKVEGWPEPAAQARQRIQRNQRVLQDPNGATPEELARTRDLIEHDTQLLEGLGTNRFTPKHQSIYDRYSRDIEKFLRQLGGQPYTDHLGHTWIEVPTQPPGATSSRVQMFGAADPKLLAAIAAAGGVAAWLAKNPDDSSRDALIAAGLIGGGVIKANPGVNMKRLATLLGPKLYGDMAKMPQVAVKEMVQNAFDAVKQTLEKGQKTPGEIIVGVDTAAKTISVADNGSGMTPEILANQFLQIAGTHKETTRSSGGLGIAKMQFLFGSKEIEVYTMRDGRLSVLKSRGEDLMGAMEDPALKPNIEVLTGEPAKRLFHEQRKLASQDAGKNPDKTQGADSGTVVRIALPETYTDSAGVTQPMEVPTWIGEYPALKSPLFENIDVHLGFDRIESTYHEMGNRFPRDQHTPLFNVKFPWGEARIMATKDPKEIYGNNVKILSNGLWQFDEKLSKDPTNLWSDSVPRQFHVDVSPSVKAEHADYPFDLNRQGFTPRAKDDFQLIKNYLNMLYSRDSLGDSVKQMSSVEYVDMAGRREKIVGLDAPPLEEGLAGAIPQGSKIEVKDGQLYVDGKLTPLLTPADMAKAKVAVENYKVPPGTIDTMRPVVHDNILMPEKVGNLANARKLAKGDWRAEEKVTALEKAAETADVSTYRSLSDYAREKFGVRFDRMNHDFGEKFIQLRDLLANLYQNDNNPYLVGLSESLKNFAVGVGYDSLWRGVNAKLPTDLMLINPAGTIRIDPVRAAAGMYGTMIHEIVHTVHRSHGETSFIPAQALLMADLAENGGAIAIRKGLISLFEKYQDITTNLHEVTNYARERKLTKPAGRNLSNESDFEARDTSALGDNLPRGGAEPAANPPPPNPSGGNGPAGLDGNGARVQAETPGLGSLRSGEAGRADPRFLRNIAIVGTAIAVGTTLDKDHPLQGGLLGLAAGAALASGALRNYGVKLRDALSPDKRVRIDDAGNQHEYTIERMKVDMWRLRNKLTEMVPEKGRREAITTALDTGDTSELRPGELPAYRLAKDFFDAMKHEGLGVGVLKEAREHYVTHLWDFQDQRTFGPGMSPSSKFAKARTYSTLEEGEAAGLKPLTKDIAEIAEIYGNSMGRSIANRQLLNTLKEAKTADGAGLVLKSDEAPHSYVTLTNPSLQGWRVHPDIAPSMKFLFEQGGGGAAVRAVEAFNTTVKRMAVSFSLFHAKALLDAGIAAAAHPGIAVKALGQAAIPRLFGENLYLKQLRETGVGPVVDMALKGGLKFSLERGLPGVEDVGQGFYEGMRTLQRTMDAAIPKSGAPIEAFVRANHSFDNFMWGRLHAGIKLSVFADRYARLLENGVERDVAARTAASYTNDMFGGLNWRRIAEGAASKFGRDAALATLSPNARRLAQIALFAPDWTLSTTRAFTQGIFGGTGVKGLFKPTELADLHRQYIARAALYYFVIGNILNEAFSGHPLSDNKDWTRIDMGDGRTMQWSKHTMEPVHWFTQPRQQFLNKLGYLPKEGLSQVFGVEYLAPRVDPKTGQVTAGPAMEEGRVGHVMKSLLPIGAQQFRDSGSAAGLSGTFGVPIYGKTLEQRLEEKSQRALKRAEKGK